MDRNLLAKAGLQAVLAVLMFGAGNAPRALAQGTTTETVGFSISIEPVFKVNSSSSEGGNVELGPLVPGQAAPSRTAVVSVRSNTGRPYRIIQRLEQEFPAPVQFTVTDGTQGGQSEVHSPQPLTTQSVTLFTSGPDGESDDFRINYSVASTELVPAGNYRARVLIEEEVR